MSLKAVCRLCLSMDAPMHNIADSPLRSFYEKLTDISLHATTQPALACYLCYCQLRKCHNFMARSVRADRVLTQLLRSGEIENIEIIKMKSRELLQLNGLCVTPIRLIAVEVPGHSPYTPLSPRCKEETDTDSRRCTDYVKVEESDDEEIDRVVKRYGENIEYNSSMDGEEINEQSEDAVNIQTDRWTGPGDIKQEKPEEDGTYVRRCIGYLKCEDSEEYENIVKNERVTDGKETEYVEWKVEAVNVEIVEVTGAAPTEECKETLAEIIHDGQLTPGHSGKRMFICNDCGKIFDDKYLLKEHIERHVTVKMTNYRNSLPQYKQMFSRESVVNKHAETRNLMKLFECQICQRRFTGKWNLNRHMQTHTGIKPFECEICKVRFSEKCHLKIHLKVHTKEKPYECEICKVRFSEKCNLKRHLRVHTKEKPYECEICKVRFRDNSNLKIHLRIHTKEKPYECEICKVRFSNKCSIKTHLSVHTKEKPYKCEICNVGFSEKGNLKIHSRIHTKEKPYECEICNVRFSYKCSLKTHLRVHTKEKPYKCEICKVRFSEKSNLKIHLRIHTKEKPYECEICKARFSHKCSLKTHLRVHTKEKPYECEICKVKFSQKGNLNTHLRVHTKEKPHECEICKVRFSDKSALNSHLRVHTKEKPYECEICKIRFSQMGHLKSHLRVHSKEKPYECEICKVRFSRKDNLKTHSLKTHSHSLKIRARPALSAVTN